MLSTKRARATSVVSDGSRAAVAFTTGGIAPLAGEPDTWTVMSVTCPDAMSHPRVREGEELVAALRGARLHEHVEPLAGRDQHLAHGVRLVEKPAVGPDDVQRVPLQREPVEPGIRRVQDAQPLHLAGPERQVWIHLRVHGDELTLLAVHVVPQRLVRRGRAARDREVLQHDDVSLNPGERRDRIVGDVEGADEAAPELLGDGAMDVRVVQAEGAGPLPA